LTIEITDITKAIKLKSSALYFSTKLFSVNREDDTDHWVSAENP